MEVRVEENKQTVEYLKEGEETKKKKEDGRLKYKKVPIRVLTVGIPGNKRNTIDGNTQND